MESIEEKTKAFRLNKAGSLHYQSMIARSVNEISKANWHEVRATGQQERFERVAEYGTIVKWDLDNRQPQKSNKVIPEK